MRSIGILRHAESDAEGDEQAIPRRSNFHGLCTEDIGAWDVVDALALHLEDANLFCAERLVGDVCSCRHSLWVAGSTAAMFCHGTTVRGWSFFRSGLYRTRSLSACPAHSIPSIRATLSNTMPFIPTYSLRSSQSCPSSSPFFSTS